jgi:hypothetical protein
MKPVKTYTGGKAHPVEYDAEKFFEKARIVAKQLDLMSDEGTNPTFMGGSDAPKLLANRIITPDGTMLQSMHQHDCVTHTDKNGKLYMVDGGISYRRGIVQPDAPAKDACVYNDDPHEIIRDAFHWGTRGKSGREPVEYKPISSLSNMHIHNIRMTQTHVPEHVAKVFADEEFYRRDNGIVIED